MDKIKGKILAVIFSIAVVLVLFGSVPTQTKMYEDTLYYDNIYDDAHEIIGISIISCKDDVAAGGKRRSNASGMV